MMFKSIKKIQSFGVFKNFSSSPDLLDFNEKNIIYGWNYSGKTTLSRIFSSIENRILHQDYSNGKFRFELDDSSQLNESNLVEKAPIVRVFNSDFIDHNLSWNGELINPILLLGEDTIEAEKKIEKYEELVNRCRVGYRSKMESEKNIGNDISTLKTSTAKQIKRNLNIIEVFNATHLSKILATLPNDPKLAILDENKVSNHLRKALAKNSDRLALLSPVEIEIGAKDFFERCNEKMGKTPEFSSIIDYLKDNPTVSMWIEKGLEVNEGKKICEFCGGKIEKERINILEAHFSKDLANYKSDIKSLISTCEGLKKTYTPLSLLSLYNEFRDGVEVKNEEIQTNLFKYNSQIDELIKQLKIKFTSPFSDVERVTYSIEYENKIKESLLFLNNTIKNSNEASTNFDIEKKESLRVLKMHYAASFLIDNEIEKKEEIKQKMGVHKVKYQNIAESYKKEIEALQASISKAQKGKEILNNYIELFLGRDEIKIDVIEHDGYERFRLSRDGNTAKNLSEGEKSAIAFSFFLTKLGELSDLKEAVVYIDDPISSLDSNHIFQVNALIKDYFFEKVQNPNNGSPQWGCKCKQIFISTHNFEFFSLLKELPLGAKKSSSFQIKRVNGTESKIINLPKSIKMYSSEYHYLFNVIHKFYMSENKEDLELLLSIPNAVRRFVELYTYSRIPSFTRDSVDQRAEQLFGAQDSKRILKVLHYFSHLNNIERLANNSDLICDIGNAVDDIISHLKKDELHYEALISSVE